VTCICGLVINTDAERLSSLLTKLPALEKISALSLRAHPGAAVAATQDFLAGAARVIGCCSSLHSLDLRIRLATGWRTGCLGQSGSIWPTRAR